jgi:hypothetical protein
MLESCLLLGLHYKTFYSANLSLKACLSVTGIHVLVFPWIPYSEILDLDRSVSK